MADSSDTRSSEPDPKADDSSSVDDSSSPDSSPELEVEQLDDDELEAVAKEAREHDEGPADGDAEQERSGGSERRSSPPPGPPPPSERQPRQTSPSDRPLPKPAFQRVTHERYSQPPPMASPPEVVGDIMIRKVVAVTVDDTLEQIEAGMQRFRYRYLPVVGRDHKLLGMVTHRVLLTALFGGLSRDVDHGPLDDEEQAPPSGDDDHEPDSADDRPSQSRVAPLDRSTKVQALMTQDVLTARADTPLVRAAEAMLGRATHCLPVVTEDGTLIGVITATDFVKIVAGLLRSS